MDCKNGKHSSQKTNDMVKPYDGLTHEAMAQPRKQTRTVAARITLIFHLQVQRQYVISVQPNCLLIANCSLLAKKY